MPSLTAFRIHDSVAAEDLGFPTDLDGGGLFGELGNEDFTTIEDFRMMQARVFSTGKSDDVHAVFFSLNDDVVRMCFVCDIFLIIQSIVPSMAAFLRVRKPVRH